MDGKGRWVDNVFIERLWRSLKYEEVYLHGYDNIPKARDGIRRWMDTTTGENTRPLKNEPRIPSTTRT